MLIFICILLVIPNETNGQITSTRGNIDHSCMAVMRSLVSTNHHVPSASSVPKDLICENCQGRPGKMGPKGATGTRGPIGQRGAPGQCVCNASDLAELNQQIAILNAKFTLLRRNTPESCLSGIKSGIIPSSALKSSSEHPHCRTPTAKLDSETAWCILSLTASDIWLQVDLGKIQPVTGIVTQGRKNDEQWVTHYKVFVGSDEDDLKPITESGAVVTFTGNNDRTTKVWNEFPQPMSARIVRIYPLAYHVWYSMRFDVFFC